MFIKRFYVYQVVSKLSYQTFIFLA